MTQPIGRLVAAVATTFLVMVVVPFPFYGLFSALGWAAIPEQTSPGLFFSSVLVTKIGVALGFVLVFWLAVETFSRQWKLYALIWWAMYTVVEAGQALAPGYSLGDAVAGSLSEAVYFPLSSYLVARLLGRSGT